MANGNGIRDENDSARQMWVIGTVALLSVVIVLLIALLMIGIPYLNAKVIQGTGLSSSDLASWQLTSVITMVGMLVGGVFIITAFRVDATAKHTASVETKEVVGRALDEEKTRLKATISDAESAVAKANKLAKEGELQVGKAIKKAQEDVKAAVGKAESEARAAKENAESEVEEAIKQGNSAIDRAVQDAEIRTTAAINSESERFRQATQTALGQSREEFGQSIRQVQADGRAVREFLDERAPGIVRSSFTEEQIEGIRERVVARLTDDLLAEEVAKAVEDMVEEHPQKLVDPVVERVAAMGRWRWLFRSE